MPFIKNIATFKMDIVKIRATLKMSFSKNCGTLKNTEIYIKFDNKSKIFLRTFCVIFQPFLNQLYSNLADYFS